MPRDISERWDDRDYLRAVQYADDSNLAARQSIYAFGHPRIDLAAEVIDAVAPAGAAVVADVGCGNGGYLAELARRGHRGHVLGIDLSAGMLAAARGRELGSAVLLGGDAGALPLRSGACDLTMAMHMLYHVPDPGQAVGELARVTRPGGTVVVVLNGDDHLAELRAVIASALAGTGLGPSALRGDPDVLPWDKIRLGQGADLLAAHFGSVVRHDFPSELRIPGPLPVASYVRSMSLTPDPADLELLVSAVLRRLDFDADGYFTVTAHCGCLICT